MKSILIVENGAGFGGALTSIGSFLHAVPLGEWEFHVLTSYQQDYLQPIGAIVAVGVIERNRRYGSRAKFEQFIRPVSGKWAGNLAFLVDYLTTGRYYAEKIARYITQFRIDLVHTNNGTLINDAAIRGANKAGVPVVVHVRAPEYAGHTVAWLATKVDHFLPVSRYVADSVAALGVKSDRITIVPEGLDVFAFKTGANGSDFRFSVGLPVDIPVIGMVGCLVDWKGHGIFLDACAKVFPKTNAVALIVGDTPNRDPEFLHELQEQAKRLGISDRVWFVGHRNDVASAMAACDVIVHASTAPEPFGRVILEGMSLGKAVIATNAGGPGEIINDGIDGLLVPCGDATKMADALYNALINESTRETLGKSAASKIIDFYGIETHCEKIVYEYKILL